MPARKVTHQQKEAMSLEAATVQFSPQVSGSCAAFWASIVPEGEPMPQSDEERIVAIGAWLASNRERTVEADDAYDEALRQRHLIVTQRDEAAKELRETIIEVRRNFEGVYGQGQTKKILGLVPDITDEAVQLQRYARAAVKKMQQPGFAFEASPEKLGTIEAVDVIARILPDLEVLEDILSQVDFSKRFVQNALKQKEAASTQLGRANGLVARYLEALFFLVGEDFLGQRLRQSSHVSSESADDGSGDPASSDDDPAEPPSVDDVEPPAVLAAPLDEPDDVGAVELLR